MRGGRRGRDPEDPSDDILDLARSPLARLWLNSILKDAITRQAAQVVSSRSGRHASTSRLVGGKRTATTVPPEAVTAVAARLRVMAGLELAGRRPQRGRFSLTIGRRRAHIEVAARRETRGESVRLRLLPSWTLLMASTPPQAATGRAKPPEVDAP